LAIGMTSLTRIAMIVEIILPHTAVLSVVRVMTMIRLWTRTLRTMYRRVSNEPHKNTSPELVNAKVRSGGGIVTLNAASPAMTLSRTTPIAMDRTTGVTRRMKGDNNDNRYANMPNNCIATTGAGQLGA